MLDMTREHRKINVLFCVCVLGGGYGSTNHVPKNKSFLILDLSFPKFEERSGPKSPSNSDARPQNSGRLMVVILQVWKTARYQTGIVFIVTAPWGTWSPVVSTCWRE